MEKLRTGDASLANDSSVKPKKYTLINRDGSGGFVIEAVLKCAGLGDDEVEYWRLDSQPCTPIATVVIPQMEGAPTVQNINPWGQVPIIFVGDPSKKKMVTESAAILNYLAMEEPTIQNGKVLSWNENPQAYIRWSVFLAVNVYEAILRLNYPSRYIDKDSEHYRESVKSSAKQSLTRAFTVIEHEINSHEDSVAPNYLLGPKFSACDIFLAQLFAWFSVECLDEFPHCSRITHAVATHPIVRSVWIEHFIERRDGSPRRLKFNWHDPNLKLV